MLHRLPWRSLNKDCLLMGVGSNFITILYVYLLSLKGFFVEWTEWNSFLDVPPWFFLIESVLLSNLIRSSFFYYSAIILEIFLAASWMSDLPFFVTNISYPSFSGQYMLDHLNLFSLGKDKNGATNLIVA